MDKTLLNLGRFLLTALIIFEFSNQVGIFNQPLTFTWAGLIITAISVWAILELLSFYIKQKCGEPLPGIGLALLIATIIIYLDAFGDIFLLYAQYGWYDQAAHFIAGTVSGGIFFSMIRVLTRCRFVSLNTIASGFVAWSSSLFFGVLYEFEEYFEDMLTGSHRLGDGFDTANDLFLGFLGAFIVIAVMTIKNHVPDRDRPAN